jgi:uncharacterized protein YecT (DUF1311 family)
VRHNAHATPTKFLRFIPLLLLIAPLMAAQKAAQISEEELQKFFSKAPDCEGVHIDTLDYFDFAGSGSEDAVVMASTCATGTAGPDVHSVVRRQGDGSLVELKIPEPTAKQWGALFGRVFYDLRVEKGLLVETFYDESGRKEPLVIKLRWSAGDNQFLVADTKMPPRYKASFDCDRARTEIENAICYSETASSLDIALSRAYQTWLDHLDNADSDILMKEQKEWLHKRDVICGADYEVFGCLTTLYQARLLEVQSYRHVHPANPPSTVH